MKRYIPADIDEETKIVKSLSFFDLGVLFIGILFVCLVIASSMPNWAKIILFVVIGVTFILAVVKFEMVKGYKILLYGFLYLLRKKKFVNVNVPQEMKLIYHEDCVENSGSFAAVVEIHGVDFGILEERTQDAYIAVFADALKEIRNGKIIKLEQPLNLSKYIEYNDRLSEFYFDQKVGLGEAPVPEIDIRLEMLQNQNDYLNRFQYFDRIFVEGFYIVMFESSPIGCQLLAEGLVSTLNGIGLMPRILKDDELKEFTSLYLLNDITDFYQKDKVRESSEDQEPEEMVASGDEAPETCELRPESATDSAELDSDAILSVNEFLSALQTESNEDDNNEKSEIVVGAALEKAGNAPEGAPESPENAFAEEIDQRDDDGSNAPQSAQDGSERITGSDEAEKPIEGAGAINSEVISIEERSNKISFNGKDMRIVALGKYPVFVSNAWAFELFAIPGTKMIFSFAEYPSKNINKRISRTMTELNSRINHRKTREDEKKKYLTAYQSLDALLEGLEYDSEKIYNTECYLMYPKERHREILRFIRGKGIKINDLLWTQYDGWLSTNPFIPMPNKANKERVSTIQSSSIAGMFPFVAKMLMDDDGFYLGASTRYPVFFNQFTRSQTRVNNNMVIFGKSGGGKSFFMKKLAMRGAMENKKIFILDPENEYDYLCNVLHGNWIDVAGERVGRMNPLHVFASMKDDDASNVGDVASHKLFLEEFFKTVVPDMPTECRLFLNECISQLYINFNITDLSIISAYKPSEFPTFNDLYELIKKEKGKVSGGKKNVFEMLELYLKQFVGDGLYARLWNGETTLNISNDFNVLNFQSLFANNNTAIANGQMLLLMRFLNQEVIKNREVNKRGGAKKYIEIWIDEAHRFINPDFPVALTFMSTMAKQIRKYDGGLIVATQNIDDFVGTSDEMRARASSVINNCQYSMIFSLLANDINKIKELYANYNGGFTQQEIDYIAHAKQGEALFIVDINTRLPLHIELYDNELKYIIPGVG